ncbi:hypothetical protein N7510_000862 [Penicillium lagena]|uniref:uncharacterized protein n=1 Tax=Penicillium lagena TaxID=94218 RepID=UPI002541FBAA|nr:uncharacterized protein N7510_000862 [Penicillium lagena]KAJ5624553.1 hypothetical protein N7510_000862 [Penicillium lagena]
MSAMDCGPGNLHFNTYFPPPRLQAHIKNQDSSSSSASHDVMSSGERIPSPRRWSPTFQPRRRSRQYPNSLSFIPSPALPQSETHEQAPSLRRRLATRAPLTISPFRSVRKMKEPFQLMLPSSPVSLESAPTFGDKSLESGDPVAGLTLRTWRSDQNLTSASLEAFGLLPSPPISDSRPASVGAEESYFDSKPESDTNTEVETVDDDATPGVEESTKNINLDEKVTYKAYRPPGWEDTEQDQRRTDVKNVHEAHSHFVRHCESIDESGPDIIEDETGLAAASPEPKKTEPVSILGSSPRVHRPRTATMSSEASWVPSNFSYCERWLQCVPHDMLDDQDEHPPEFNRRKFRIVENDPPMPKLDIIPGAKVLDEPVRFAVASKPKLVDIARQSPIPPPLPPLSLLPTNSVPATPHQRQVEVSAFSPDTPLDMSDSGYGTRDSGYSADSFHEDSKDDEYTDPGSLTSDSVTSTVVNDRPESAQGERNISPSPRYAPSSELSEKEERENLWNHEWTLDQLDHSVKDFPRHMLRLTSPVIIHIRKNEEKALIRPFRTIFPEVAENLLDCLCAALIARNYLVTLSSIHRRKPSLSQRSGTYAIDSVPTKAYSTLGIQLPSGSPGRIKDRVLGSRSIELRRELEKIVDNLLFAICGRSDAILKSAVEVLAQVLETTALD